MLTIGSYQLANNLLLAPMAGITDYPFRNVCLRYGVGMTTSEMVTADIRLWHSKKSRSRLVHHPDPRYVRSVQIAGTEPMMLAQAAAENVKQGAQVIDINMGCPAKKVCHKAAGSALLRDERLVKEILLTVLSTVNVPVTLKFRTGWSSLNRNAITIAQIAENAGVAALALHGRSKADAYKGCAEYETIRQVKAAVSIPVIANGDIHSAKDLAFLQRYTKADGFMFGRAALGQPWLFQQLNHFLQTGDMLPIPDKFERIDTIVGHIRHIHQFYGDAAGVRIARKHIGWYLDKSAQAQTRQTTEWKKRIFAILDPDEQVEVLGGILLANRF
ncbi:MAG TPA: tRNA dihydrouridine synthase DusB [Thiothrix sp.]|nr:tRNA dihydrouridine synthase DusB [Thiothrix sp.]